MIYLIITTCLNSKYGKQSQEHRKLYYIKAITKALEYSKNLPIKRIIVENNGKRETFLDQFSNEADIVYTDNNSVPTSNKAQNEYLDIKEIIQKYQIQDDETIIKLTGRYILTNGGFFRYTVNNNFDASLKFYNICTLTFCRNDCLLGLYAIKAKYFKDFKYEFKKSPEIEFATYVKNNIYNLRQVQYLSLMYCLAENCIEILV
uniref:Glycosyltransferase n=1 Tax=viral metagenome TaxID=1070528 RepID=A0A6C0DI11_9ZZZZ